VSGDDKQRLQKMATLAKDTFRASFGERLRGMPEILLSTPFKDAIETMVEWSSQLLPLDAERRSFSTIEECSSWSKELVSQTDPSSSNGHARRPWPFIQKVRVYLKAYILSKGLIIADLPGLRDLNSARQAVTERYFRQCHQVFAVARMGRAITDESIKHIFDQAHSVGLTKVDIVCTRSDQIQPKQAVDDWPTERATIKEMQRKIAVAKQEIASLNEVIDELYEGNTNLTQEKMKQLRSLLKEKIKAEEKHNFKLTNFIVSLRNGKVSLGLQEEYGNHPVATPLCIFCVSNEIYWDNREKPYDAELPYLSLSGILDLRRHCIGVVAQSRLQATRNFVKDEIPALIGSIGLWVEAGSGNASAESKRRILHAVSTMRQEVDEVRSSRFLRW
jgi:hypothetical protein